MEYKITISEQVQEEGKSYPTSKEIYTQVKDDVDLEAIIKAFNKIV